MNWIRHTTARRQELQRLVNKLISCSKKNYHQLFLFIFVYSYLIISVILLKKVEFAGSTFLNLLFFKVNEEQVHYGLFVETVNTI